MTKRTPQIEAGIIHGFANGRSLRAMCRQYDISRTAFLKWKQSDPDLLLCFEEAMLLHAEALVDDCIAIAEDPAIDLGEGRSSRAGMDMGELLRHARFRIDSRLKIARIYFKRHDAIAARRAEEHLKMHLAYLAEEAAEATTEAKQAASEAASSWPVRDDRPAAGIPAPIHRAPPAAPPQRPHGYAASAP